MMNRRILLAVISIGFVSLLTIGLAVPGIIVHVQNIGAGSGSISSPVYSGTLCVPYEYYVEVYYLGVIPVGTFTVPLDNITEVYPGNFTENIPASTNLSVLVNLNSDTVSKGTTTLASTLGAGNYTSVDISPSINSSVALTADFEVVLLFPQYSVSGGKITLSIQQLGVGQSTGKYTDARIYLGDINYRWYVLKVYLDLRCYSLSFYPSSLASAVFMFQQLDVILDSINEWRHCCPHRPRLCSNRNLERLIMSSPYYRMFPQKVMRVMDELAPQFNELINGTLQGNGSWITPLNLTNTSGTDLNLTVPYDGSGE